MADNLRYQPMLKMWIVKLRNGQLLLVVADIGKNNRQHMQQ